MASPNEIIDAIETLAVHCRPPVMSQEERSRWIASWIEDLRNFPADAIQAACRRWRNGTDRKFPLPGQLKPMVEAADQTNVKPVDTAAWRPLSPAEYEALSLRDKIRHQNILAHECRLKAGPQSKGLQSIPAADMPPQWHTWRRQAEDHEEEARRLRKLLRDAERMAAQ